MHPATHTALEDSSSALSRRNLALSVLATGIGLAIGWLDLHVTEVMVTVLALLAGGFILGLLQPVAAWRWGVLMAIGLPVMEVLALAGGWQTAEPVHIDIRILLAALAFAMLGAYSQIFIRRVARALAARSG